MKKIIIIILILTLALTCIIYAILTNETRKASETNANSVNKIEEFSLLFENTGSNEVYNLINKNENLKYDYSIYSYGGVSKVKINNEVLDLKTALLDEKINMNNIIEKCVKDASEGIIKQDKYMDGGTMVYMYNDFWVFKGNSLNGNKDVYITKPNVLLNDIYTAIDNSN